MSPGKITESVGIRPMQDSDLPFIRLGLSETNWQDIPDDQRKFLKQSETDKRVFDDFERYLRTERYKFTVFVATAANGEQMRYVSAGELTNPAVGLRHGGVLDFWVAPEYRERGVGTLLLDHALEQIRRQGYTDASILVSASNKKAISMYERRGFRPDRITMMKMLEPVKAQSQ